jgi:arsenate reductase-like glutaredoxin family protein
MITEHVDNMVPETADIELNFALKRYYLGQFLTETEVEDIIKQREKEIEEMCGQMELTNYEQLNPTEEEVKAFVEYTQERIDAVMKEREEAIKRITEQEKLYTYAEAPVEESKGI